MTIWLNGDFLDESDAKIAVHSAAAVLGWGVFSTIGVQNGVALAPRRHLARLRHDAAKMHIECPFDDETLVCALNTALNRNRVTDGVARLTLTKRGDGRWNQTTGSDFSILAAARAALALNDLKLTISPFRFDSRRPLAGVKSTSHLDYQLAWQEAQSRGFDEAILLNQNGALCECSRANLFWVRGGELFTPSLACGCLPGIGRSLIVEAAQQAAIPLREGVFLPQELSCADEVFVTSATSGPRGVSRAEIDCEADCDAETWGSPGIFTGQLQKWWQENVKFL